MSETNRNSEPRYQCVGCGRRFHFACYVPNVGYVSGLCGHCGDRIEGRGNAAGTQTAATAAPAPESRR